jgi:hypothetical protein
MLLDKLVDTSAILNDLAIPGRSLERVLSSHAFNLFINNDDEIYKVLLRGSGTALKFDGRELLVCTQHQLQGIERQQVGMLADDGGVLVTSGGMRHFSPSTETDAYDLVAFDFSEPCQAQPTFRPRFFSLRRVPPHVPLDKIIGVILTGFPFRDQQYDLGESNHIGIGRRSVLCTMGSKAPADDALLTVVPRETLSFDPDGMSGGSAFVVQIVDGKFHADFAGVIVRGGSNGFQILKAGLLWNFLERIKADWPALP